MVTCKLQKEVVHGLDMLTYTDGSGIIRIDAMGKTRR